MKKFRPNSIKTVAICGKDDTVMRDLCKEFDIEIVIYDVKKKIKSLGHKTEFRVIKKKRILRSRTNY